MNGLDWLAKLISCLPITTTVYKDWTHDTQNVASKGKEVNNFMG